MRLFDFFRSRKKNAKNNLPKANDSSYNQNLSWVDTQYISDPKQKEAELLKIERNTNDVISLHFTYNQLIDLYYKQRDEWENALENCKKYCIKSIEHTPKFLSKDKRDHEKLYDGERAEYTPPLIPSFKRLAIIYEKEKRYGDAIEVCKKALRFNLRDGTKGGFEGRIQRLKKKQMK